MSVCFCIMAGTAACKSCINNPECDITMWKTHTDTFTTNPKAYSVETKRQVEAAYKSQSTIADCIRTMTDFEKER